MEGSDAYFTYSWAKDIRDGFFLSWGYDAELSSKTQ